MAARNARRVTINGKRIHLPKGNVVPFVARPAREVYPEFVQYRQQKLPAPPRRPAQTSSGHGFVYIIWHPKQYEQVGVLKIGFTSDLAKRLGSANTWSFSGSFEYLAYAPVCNMRAAEAAMHKAFAADRFLGNEWFKVDEETARSVLALLARNFPLTPAQAALLRLNVNQSEGNA